MTTAVASEVERGRQHAQAFITDAAEKFASGEIDRARYSFPARLSLQSYVQDLASQHGLRVQDGEKLDRGQVEVVLASGTKTTAPTTTPVATKPSAGAASTRRTPPAAIPAYAVIDVETTGLSPRFDRVLELAIVRVDRTGNVIDEWIERFNPEGTVGATHIHGITQADVADAPLFRSAAPQIVSRVAGLPIVAHNAPFDVSFLHAELQRAGWDVPQIPSFCTLAGSKDFLPDLDRRRLVDCCWAADVPLTDAHSALGDARAAAGLLQRYLTGLGGARPRGDLITLPASAQAIAWPRHPSRLPSDANVQVGTRITQTRRPARQARRTPPLIRQLTGLTLLDVLEEGAPDDAVTYVEMLLDSLEDGEISASEASQLADLIHLYNLKDGDVTAAHHALILALAHKALDDGHVSREERDELHSLATMLSVDPGEVETLIHQADAARAARISARLRPLPENWSLGEPLHVGDHVAFTGDIPRRALLEKRTAELGVRVMGHVSRKTAMLVADGGFHGTKFGKAQQLGIRVVRPNEYAMMLKHLQPTPQVPEPVMRHPIAVPKTPVALDGQPAAFPTPATPARTASPSQIRAWALANGHTVGVRGRLPNDVIEAFDLAHFDTARRFALLDARGSRVESPR